MKQFLPSLVLLGAGMLVAVPHAIAQTASPAPTKSAKPAAKPAPKKPAKPPAKKTAKELKITETKEGSDEDDKEPDTTGSISIDYKCELGNNVTIFENAADDKHIALRWNKRLVRLTRVDTSTGANRFENRRQGLVWIGIPAKGILLDSKKGQQLANDCKNAEQMVRKEVPSDEPGILASPKETGATPVPATPAKPAAPEKPRS